MVPQFHHFRSHVQTVVDAALEAADPARAVRQVLHRDGSTLRVGATDPAAYLDNNDSYAFFRALEDAAQEGAGGLLNMSPTGTNVNDLLFTLTYLP